MITEKGFLTPKSKIVAGLGNTLFRKISVC